MKKGGKIDIVKNIWHISSCEKLEIDGLKLISGFVNYPSTEGATRDSKKKTIKNKNLEKQNEILREKNKFKSKETPFFIKLLD